MSETNNYAGPFGWVRRLYDWVLGWAETPYGAPALFVLAFAESSFFPIPPDVLLIALAVAAPTKAFRFAAICTAGSVLGGVAGYAIGVYGWEAFGQSIVHAYHGEPVMEKIQGWYNEYGFWGTLAAAITPIPYKVFTISSGVFKFPFIPFLLASVIGRAFRFFLVAALIRKFGPSIKDWIETRFNLAVSLFTVALIAGFAAIKLLR
jgi:membrane protein YqaA with SNARE-associated domain